MKRLEIEKKGTKIELLFNSIFAPGNLSSLSLTRAVSKKSLTTLFSLQLRSMKFIRSSAKKFAENNLLFRIFNVPT